MVCLLCTCHILYHGQCSWQGGGWGSDQWSHVWYLMFSTVFPADSSSGVCLPEVQVLVLMISVREGTEAQPLLIRFLLQNLNCVDIEIRDHWDQNSSGFTGIRCHSTLIPLHCVLLYRVPVHVHTVTHTCSRYTHTCAHSLWMFWLNKCVTPCPTAAHTYTHLWKHANTLSD